ncbi:MAG TPA: hypothetical protein VNO26_00890 [Candidatus Limnocylindria bacterium]|nr:hypothetical protein [Candidatus Limnocylindria bacterium]
MTPDDEEARAAAVPLPADPYYQGTITRVYYGSESGVLRSDATGREYRFKAPFVEIRGPIPRVGGLREGMRVGFDLSRLSSGTVVSVIRVRD